MSAQLTKDLVFVRANIAKARDAGWSVSRRLDDPPSRLDRLVAAVDMLADIVERLIPIKKPRVITKNKAVNKKTVAPVAVIGTEKLPNGKTVTTYERT